MRRWGFVLYSNWFSRYVSFVSTWWFTEKETELIFESSWFSLKFFILIWNSWCAKCPQTNESVCMSLTYLYLLINSTYFSIVHQSKVLVKFSLSLSFIEAKRKKAPFFPCTPWSTFGHNYLTLIYRCQTHFPPGATSASRLPSKDRM